MNTFNNSEYSNIQRNVENFININLSSLLTDQSALPYQWYGGKGFIAIDNFSCMKIILGNTRFLIVLLLFISN